MVGMNKEVQQLMLPLYPKQLKDQMSLLLLRPIGLEVKEEAVVVY